MSLSTPAPAADRSPKDLAGLLVRYAELIRTAQIAVIPNTPGLERFYGMMAYHLGWVDRDFSPQTARAGKSLRPALCLLMAEGLGARLEECVPLAGGIELLHQFSLIHDDIVDRGLTRRGRPAVWTVWGEQQAINAGDGMFSLAHTLWLQTPLAERDPAAFVSIVRSLERTVLALCEGQFQDISGEGSLAVTSSAYVDMIGRKTAALIGEAAWVGARAATGDLEVLDAARAFGYQLGIAFQIRDDLLGIWGDEAATGKSASSDIATRKMTLPIVEAFEHGTAGQCAALRAIYGRLPRSEHDEAEVRTLLEVIGADQRAAKQEEAHWQAAMQALDRIALPPIWRNHLHTFARTFVARQA